METYVPPDTSVPRVGGHLNPVLLAASSPSLEPRLRVSASAVHRGSTAGVQEPHSRQVAHR